MVHELAKVTHVPMHTQRSVFGVILDLVIPVVYSLLRQPVSTCDGCWTVHPGRTGGQSVSVLGVSGDHLSLTSTAANDTPSPPPPSSSSNELLTKFQTNKL